MSKIKRDSSNKFSEEKKLLEVYLEKKYQNTFDMKALETKPKEDSFLEVSVSEGKFLEFLVRLKKPKSILEVGTFRGFSAFFLARYLGDNRGKIWSIEKDERRFPEIESLWKKLEISKNAELLKGDAVSILQGLKKQGKKFDMFFIDARKKDTKEYFKLCYSLAKEKALIVVDNTLWGGEVVDDNPQNIAADYMKDFNDFVFKKYKNNSYILPAWDGLTIVIK